MASEDDRRSMPINSFLTPGSHLHVIPQQQQANDQQGRHNRLHETPLQPYAYTSDNSRSFAPITPYYGIQQASERRITTDHHHDARITPLLMPPTRSIPHRPPSRISVSTRGSFAHAELFQDVSHRSRQLDETLQELARERPLTIPNGTPDDVESGPIMQESIRTISPPTWSQPEIQTVSSHTSVHPIWTEDAISLFPTPHIVQDDEMTHLPNIPFSYDVSSEIDRQEIRTNTYPTPIPIRVLYHCKGHRYRTNSRTELQTVWRLEVQEGYTGAFHEWNFQIQPGWYEFECCGNPLVLIGMYHGSTYMFSYPLQRQPQFARQGLLLPICRSSTPSPCYLEAATSRGYRIGGFLHPAFYGVPGDHTEILHPSRHACYMPMDVFTSEGIIVCQSWAAAKTRAIVGSYFGRGGTSNVIQNDNIRGLLTRASTRRPFECLKPALVPYLEHQLRLLGLLDPSDGGGTFSRPTDCYGSRASLATPVLLSYNVQQKTSFLWPPNVRDRLHPHSASDHLGDVRPRYAAPLPTAGRENIHGIATGDDLEIASPPVEDERSVRSRISIRSQSSLEVPVREVFAKSPADTVSMRSSTSSEEERRRSERRNDRMKDIPELPPDSVGARKWAEGLEWRLMTDDWTQDNVHAVDITETTVSNSRLSSDFLALILNSAMKHKSIALQEAVQSKLSEIVEGPNGSVIDGRALLKSGKGFEIFQLRVKTGFRRGLGSEAMDEFDAFMSATQRDREDVASFARRVADLHKQASESGGEPLGEVIKSRITLRGLKLGVYRTVLGSWVKKLELGHGRHDIRTPIQDLIQIGGDILTDSAFFRDGKLLAGQSTPKARLAGIAETGTDAGEKHSNHRIEKMVSLIRQDKYIPNWLTSWKFNHFDCGICNRFKTNVWREKISQLEDP